MQRWKLAIARRAHSSRRSRKHWAPRQPLTSDLAGSSEFAPAGSRSRKTPVATSSGREELLFRSSPRPIPTAQRSYLGIRQRLLELPPSSQETPGSFLL